MPMCFRLTTPETIQYFQFDSKGNMFIFASTAADREEGLTSMYPAGTMTLTACSFKTLLPSEVMV